VDGFNDCLVSVLYQGVILALCDYMTLRLGFALCHLLEVSVYLVPILHFVIKQGSAVCLVPPVAICFSFVFWKAMSVVKV